VACAKSNKDVTTSRGGGKFVQGDGICLDAARKKGRVTQENGVMDKQT